MQQARILAAQAQERADGLTIPAEALAQAHDAVAARAVRLLIGRLKDGNDNCTAAHLRGVLEVSRSADPSAEANLPDGLTARREYGLLILTRGQPQPLTGKVCLELPGVTQTDVYRLECREVEYWGQGQQPWCFFLSQERAPSIWLRSRQTGDCLTRPNRPGKRVKKLLIDEKIPLQSRDALPVLEVLGQVAAVAGLGPDIAFVPKEGERAWNIIITPLNQGV